MNFDIAVGRNGDCFDRYLIRVLRCEVLLNLGTMFKSNSSGDYKLDLNKFVYLLELYEE